MKKLITGNFDYNLIVVLFAFLFSVDINAQNKQFYSLKNTPFSNAYSLIKDSKGFIWIGTNGVVKYDGYDMQLYNDEKENKNKYYGNETWLLFESKNGVLWAGGTKGLSRYNTTTDKFTFYDTSKQNRTHY